MELVAFILIALGVILLAAVVFGFWIVAKTIKVIVFGFKSLVSPMRPKIPPQRANVCRCPRPQCGADNIAAARFCRRCGTSLLPGSQAQHRLPDRSSFRGPEQVPVHRVAAW